MFAEPYETSVLRSYPVNKLKDQVEVQFIEGALAPVMIQSAERADPNEQVLFEILPGNKDIDLLQAPLLFNTREGARVVIDSRATKRAGRHGHEATVASPTDFRFAKESAILSYLWANEGPVAFSQMGELPIRVYARWVSEGISRKLGLDPGDFLRLQIVAAYYYVSSFMAEAPNPQRVVGAASLIGRALHIPMDKILPVIGECGQMANVNDLVNAMKGGESASPRLEHLTAGFVYTLLHPTWYGAHKAITVSIALEYPPVFLTMLLSAYTERSYHSSYFAKTALAADKRHQSHDFVMAMNHVSRGLTG